MSTSACRHEVARSEPVQFTDAIPENAQPGTNLKRKKRQGESKTQHKFRVVNYKSAKKPIISAVCHPIEESHVQVSSNFGLITQDVFSVPQNPSVSNLKPTANVHRHSLD